ncbi:MAG: type I-E CRISPR-associated protein Cas6/Cse3/CasE [Methanolinea sp.]|nr:type I-E CRISPR-associated protein Cas6/Cse3/CasE [Methanolinea sp.]
MYFSRIRIRPDASLSPEFWKIATGPYQIHAMVWDLYSDGEMRTRDFLYRVDYVRNRPAIYSVSRRKPVYNGSIWAIETKEYNPVLFSGQRLWFSLRANPVRTRWTPPDQEGRRFHRRHDVVMDAKRIIRGSQDPCGTVVRIADLVQQEGVRWLKERAGKYGFSVDEERVIAGAYRQISFLQGEKNRNVQISTIDFSGTLKVTDPELFRKALAEGIGPAKGFGCGMMMIKPA